MFTPKWKKEAKLLYKGAHKFLNYKRDLLPEERIEEIESRRADLLQAMKDGDREACTKAEKQLTNCCEKALPTYHRPNWMEENLEVFFVAIVVALGIRAYYLQPFRIPTGSMQPTLNGITGEYKDRDDFPLLRKQLEEVLAIPAEDAIPASAKMGLGIEDILEAIVARIPAPTDHEDGLLRCSVFDSVYDTYRGVVSYIRCFSGSMKRGIRVKLFATDTTYEIKETGVFTP